MPNLLTVRIFQLALCVCTLISSGLVAVAQSDWEQEKFANWHQWRGPSANGVAGPNASPPTKWSESENIAWKVKIEGEGSSTPIIWEDRVYVITAVETDQKPDSTVEPHPETKTSPTGNIFDFQTLCLDRQTGKTIWKKTLVSAAPHEGRHPSTTYASASPMTDGKHIFVSFGSYGIFCLSMDGEVIWNRDLGDMRTRRGWGEAVSPVIAGNKLIVMWDQEDQSKIFALNAADGSTAWEVERDEPTTWATPLIVHQDEIAQVVTAGTNHIRSYELEQGKMIWESPGLTLNAIPSPLLNDNNVILMSGYRGNAAVSIDLTSNDQGAPRINWRLNRDTPYVPSPLLTQGRLYFTKSNNAILSCVDVNSGESIFAPKRLPGLRSLYASPIATDKFIYFPSREGKTLVIANQKEFSVESINSLDGGIDASPAIVGNQIFIRTKTHLYCIANPTAQQSEDQKESSVKPGINSGFLNPELQVDDYVRRFEIESREVYSNRHQIVQQCEIEPGMTVADIGAGTGLFTKLFARKVGASGWVYAVDIAPNFLAHIRNEANEQGVKNVSPVLCKEDSVSLAPDSIDLAFICDTYHHFEFPKSTMESLHNALRTDGRLVLIDFERIQGKTRQWLIDHVRADKQTFQKEVEAAGFELVAENEDLGLEENYFLVFRKK